MEKTKNRFVFRICHFVQKIECKKYFVLQCFQLAHLKRIWSKNSERFRFPVPGIFFQKNRKKSIIFIFCNCWHNWSKIAYFSKITRVRHIWASQNFKIHVLGPIDFYKKSQKWPFFCSCSSWFVFWKNWKNIFQNDNLPFELWKKCWFCSIFFKKMSFFGSFLQKNAFFGSKKTGCSKVTKIFWLSFFIIFLRQKSFSRGNLRIIDFWLIGIYFFYAKNQDYSRKTNLRFFIFFRFEKHWTKSTFFMGPKNDHIKRKYATIDVFSISLIKTRSKVNLIFFKIFYWKKWLKKTQFVFPMHS